MECAVVRAAPWGRSDPPWASGSTRKEADLRTDVGKRGAAAAQGERSGVARVGGSRRPNPIADLRGWKMRERLEERDGRMTKRRLGLG